LSQQSRRVRDTLRVLAGVVVAELRRSRKATENFDL